MGLSNYHILGYDHRGNDKGKTVNRKKSLECLARRRGVPTARCLRPPGTTPGSATHICFPTHHLLPEATCSTHTHTPQLKPFTALITRKTFAVVTLKPFTVVITLKSFTVVIS